MKQALSCCALSWALGLMPGWAQAESLDPAHSELHFYGTQLGAQVEGTFHNFSANLHFDPNDLPHSTVHMTIDLNSVDLASEESEDAIKGPHWFHVAAFPQALFDATEIRSLGQNRYLVLGDLKIKGVSRHLQIPMQMSYDHSLRVAQGQFMLRRTMFNVGDGTWAETDTVKDDVVVRYRLTLVP